MNFLSLCLVCTEYSLYFPPHLISRLNYQAASPGACSREQPLLTKQFDMVSLVACMHGLHVYICTCSYYTYITKICMWQCISWVIITYGRIAAPNLAIYYTLYDASVHNNCWKFVLSVHWNSLYIPSHGYLIWYEYAICHLKYETASPGCSIAVPEVIRKGFWEDEYVWTDTNLDWDLMNRDMIGT